MLAEWTNGAERAADIAEPAMRKYRGRHRGIGRKALYRWLCLQTTGLPLASLS